MNSGERTAVNEHNSLLLHDLMAEKRTWTIEEIAYILGISFGSARELIRLNGYRKINARWLPMS